MSRAYLRLTERELRAIEEALNARLAGEIDIAGEPDTPRHRDYQTAFAKVQRKIGNLD